MCVALPVLSPVLCRSASSASWLRARPVVTSRELTRSLVKRFVVRTLCCIFIQERSRKRRVSFPRNPALEKRQLSLGSFCQTQG
ncbi:hypothetical protein VULLAG_LOCUS10462 [Vulpes lagopus]